MVSEKFSLAVFEALGKDSEESRELASLLEKEVLGEIDKVAREKFVEIVGRLNSKGHNLRLYCSAFPGDLDYRDDSGTEDTASYTCGLRLGYALVISAGYANLVKEVDE